jgi:hypothetical protein
MTTMTGNNVNGKRRKSFYRLAYPRGSAGKEREIYATCEGGDAGVTPPALAFGSRPIF